MTLLEILLVFTVIAVLALLFTPALGLLRKQSQNTKCLTHLRQCGTLLATAITEQGGSMKFWYSGNKGGGEYWNTWLVARGYITYTDLERLNCPAIPYPKDNISGRHYGIYMANTAENLVDSYSPSGALEGRAYRVNLRAIPAPASTIFMGDSVTSAGDQSIRIFRTDSGSFPSGAFHQRHQKQVNLFFYDGHAESAKPDRLYALGVRRIYNSKLQPLTLTP